MKRDNDSSSTCQQADVSQVNFQGLSFAVLTSSAAHARIVMQWITAQHGECCVYTTCAGFKQSVQRQMVDVVILDWELSDEHSSLEVLRWVRNTLHNRLRLLVTSDNDSEDAIVSALYSGADNFMTMPYYRESFLARLWAMTKRLPSQTTPLCVPPYAIDLHNRQVRHEGTVVDLTHLEYELTAFLFRHQGHILSRETLLNSVWGSSRSVEERTVDTHICRVRNKLKLQRNTSWALKAIYHRGYRLQKQTISPT